VLWSSRLLLVVGVAGSAVLAVAVLWLATVDLVRFLGDVVDYTSDGEGTARSDLVAGVVKIVDTYLLAAILVVVTFGLYELFVGRIDARRTGDGAPRVLAVRSLDDLKDRIAKLVVLILVIEFFQRALKVDIDEVGDLLVLAGGIALVSLAIVLPTLADALKRKEDTD
jgi:uncharacterized protein (TIGR00645 family)